MNALRVTVHRSSCLASNIDKRDDLSCSVTCMCTFIYLYEKHKNIKIIFIYSHPVLFLYDTGKKLGIRVLFDCLPAILLAVLAVLIQARIMCLFFCVPVSLYP